MGDVVVAAVSGSVPRSGVEHGDGNRSTFHLARHLTPDAGRTERSHQTVVTEGPLKKTPTKQKTTNCFFRLQRALHVAMVT